MNCGIGFNVSDDKRVLACRACGHIFDGDTGKHIPELKEVVITHSDREKLVCLPCHLEQKAWPDR